MVSCGQLMRLEILNVLISSIVESGSVHDEKAVT